MESVTPFASDTEKFSETVKLRAVYSDDKSSPNYSFSQATPSASAELVISNPDAWGAFELGKQYDVLFSPTAD